MRKAFSPIILLLALAMTVHLSAADPGSTPEPGQETGLAGIITIGPTHGGPIRPGMASSLPLAHADFVVQQEDREVASFTTDVNGRFRVSLPPGHYTVSKKGKKGGIGKYGPFEVDVVAGQVATVEWHCDTGMR
jgi:hypothetical protein